ncbi:hypothetical protein PIB30_055726 [Stylosanthes scabra]|uniref:Uncharacterized protein n=1 Tax=Stylosanthes scabra TaxID=79078 RepID=A0ABU6ZHT6_9FABA|nr:hypothetical protein [Stylosanthes scabra]
MTLKNIGGGWNYDNSERIQHSARVINRILGNHALRQERTYRQRVPVITAAVLVAHGCNGTMQTRNHYMQSLNVVMAHTAVTEKLRQCMQEQRRHMLVTCNESSSVRSKKNQKLTMSLPAAVVLHGGRGGTPVKLHVLPPSNSFSLFSQAPRQELPSTAVLPLTATAESWRRSGGSGGVSPNIPLSLRLSSSLCPHSRR